MKPTLLIAALALALSGVACQKKSDDTGDRETRARAAERTEMRKGDDDLQKAHDDQADKVDKLADDLDKAADDLMETADKPDVDTEKLQKDLEKVSKLSGELEIESNKLQAYRDQGASADADK